MSGLHELLLLCVVLTDFWVLGTTRLSSAIRATAIQGALLAALPHRAASRAGRCTFSAWRAVRSW